MVNGLVLFYTNGALKAPFYYKPHSPDHTHTHTHTFIQVFFFYTSEHYLTFVLTLMGDAWGATLGSVCCPWMHSYADWSAVRFGY